MESHGELIAPFLPGLTAAVSPDTVPRLPSAVAGRDLPPAEDFLTQLEQALVDPAAESPAESASMRQFLPAGGQALPPPAALTLPVVDPRLPPQQGRPAPGPAPTVVNAAPGFVPAPAPADTAGPVAAIERAETAPPLRVNDSASLEPARVRTPPRSLEPPAAGPVTAPVAAPVVSKAVPRPELPKGLAPVAKPQARVDRTTQAHPQPTGRHDLDPLGERPAEPNALRVAPVQERFEATPASLRPDGPPALPPSSPLPTTAPLTAAAPLATAETLAPASSSQASLNVPAAFPEIVDSVRTLSDRNGGEMRLRLNPPELGHLDIKVSVNEEQTFVSITANNSNAREVLEQHIGRLRTLLDAAGLDLAGAQVSSERHPERRAEGSPEWTAAPPQVDASDDTSVEESAHSPHGVDLFV